MKNFLKLFLIILAVASCSNKQAMTTSKIKIMASGSSAILSTKANNGMVLYGRSSDGKSFTKKIDVDTVDLILPNGTWNFFSIAWEVASPTGAPDFKGKTYCGKSLQQTLTGTDTTVAIDLENATCMDADFSAYSANQTAPTAEVVLPTPKFFTCKNLAGVTGNTADCDITGSFNKGYATSYRLVSYEYTKFGPDNNSAPVKLAESACIRTTFTTLTGMSEATDSATLNTFHFPTTPGNGFGLALKIFYSAGSTLGDTVGCDPSLGVDEIPITDGPRLKTFPVPAASVATSYNMFIQTNRDDVCQNIRMGNARFSSGFGTDGSPYTICTPDQFRLLSTNYAGLFSKSFEVLNDLNFGMANIDPIGEALTSAGSTANTAFTGKLNGNNHKISDFKINCKIPGGTNENNNVGLFRSLGTGVMIRNLTLNNAVVMCKSAENIGILAGTLTTTGGSSLFENIKIHGHSEGGNNIGGAIGYAMNQGSSTTLVNYLHVKGDYGGSTNLGGLFGNANNTTGSFTISKSSFNGSIHAHSSNGGSAVVSSVGGIAGSASGAGALYINEVVVKAELIEGSTRVGGFAGTTNNIHINNSYVEANLKAYSFTDGSTSHSDIGGAIGYAQFGSLTNVLAAYGTKDYFLGGADVSVGGLVGRVSTAPTSTNSFYTGFQHGSNTPVVGTSLSGTGAHAQSNYTSWSFPSIWTMPDESNDVPRLAFETATNPNTGIVVENEAPYLKRLCSGNYANSGQPKPNLICTEAQLRSSVGSGVLKTLGRNISFAGTLGTFTPFQKGVYKLDGAGFGLYNFSFQIPNLTSSEGVGVFKELESGSEISNLNFAGIMAYASAKTFLDFSSAGLVTGINRGTITKIKLFSSNLTFSDSNATTIYGFVGGVAGANYGIIKLSEFSPTVKIQNPNVSGGGLIAGGIVGNNEGKIQAIKAQGQFERLVNCPSASTTVSLSANEFYGGFVGNNAGQISEIDSQTEMRFQEYGVATNCPLVYNGYFSPFIAGNAGAGAIVEDFYVKGKTNSSFGNPPPPELFAMNNAIFNRGFLSIDASVANTLLPLTSGVQSNWDATIPFGTVSCSASDAGNNFLVTVANTGTAVGDVDNGDIIMCRNGSFAKLPVETKSHIYNSPGTVTNVIYTVSSSGVTLDKDRYYSSGLTYSTNTAGELYVSGGPSISPTGWNVGTDFLNATGKIWLMDPVMNDSAEPELARTGGNLESLGPIF